MDTAEDKEPQEATQTATRKGRVRD